jgi:hypothetical protein
MASLNMAQICILFTTNTIMTEINPGANPIIPENVLLTFPDDNTLMPLPVLLLLHDFFHFLARLQDI